MEANSKKLRDLQSTQPSTNILFKITPTIFNLYHKRSVLFTKPKLLALYQRNYHKISLANHIRYFKMPKMSEYPIDLNDGYETFRPRQSEVFSNTIYIVLNYIMSPTAEGVGDGHDDNVVDSVERTTIYTRSGTLANIMKTTYEKKFNWSVRVTRYNGHIYMAKVNDEPFQVPGNDIRKQETHHSRLDKLLFADSPNELPKINEPCDENITLNSVHRSSLGKYDIVYSDAIQGIIAEDEITDLYNSNLKYELNINNNDLNSLYMNFSNDMEQLNECRFVLSKQIWNTLRDNDLRFLRYWLYAYLAKVQDLYVAYKDSKGMVDEPIEHKIVSNLPNNRFWKPNVCTAFLHDFLERVEKLMSNVNCLNTVYEFNFNAKTRIISYEIYKDQPERFILTKEYLDFCNDKK